MHVCDAITQGETIKREIYVALAAKAKVLVALKHIATDHPTGIALSIAQWFDDRPLSALDFSHETLAGVNGGVKFGHCGGAKVGQFGASALERAALI